MSKTFTHPKKATKIADKRDSEWQSKHVSTTGKKEGFQGMFLEDDGVLEEIRNILEKWLRKPIFPKMAKHAKQNKNKKKGQKAFGGISDPSKPCPTCPDMLGGDVDIVMEKNNVELKRLGQEDYEEKLRKHKAKSNKKAQGAKRRKMTREELVRIIREAFTKRINESKKKK